MRKILTRLRTSLLARILATSVVVTALTGFLTGTIFFLSMRGVYGYELELRAKSAAQFIASQAQFSMLVHDRGELDRLARQGLSIEDVIFVEIKDLNCAGIPHGSCFAGEGTDVSTEWKWRSMHRFP
jgi:hypothetical protein